MIVKFFRHGTGGGSAVFNYLLGKDNERSQAEVLRGDIPTQKRLIDSLSFKRQYTSGCLSFEEAPDQITDQQKTALMDSFENVITAGLEADRVSFSWIEHRDKGRLELNFVIANVDLKHGRLFQPYIHSQDKTRVNAWKDIQNINHGLSDPNDPLRKRLMAQRDNLPRAVKEVREMITEGLQNMVADQLISSRNDVVEALQEAGFDIARETDSAISIKNPSGGRNIRLTGGLYERNFSFSAATEAAVEQDHRSYRDNAAKRLKEATRILHDQLERKRGYHQARHGEPRREQRKTTAAAKDKPTIYRYFAYSLFGQYPSPFKPKFHRPARGNGSADRKPRKPNRATDTRAREQHSKNHPLRNEVLGSSSWYCSPMPTVHRNRYRGIHGEQIFQTHLHPSTTAGAAADQLRAEINHGYQVTRSSANGTKSATGDNRATAADARRPGTIHEATNTPKRSGYSSIDSLIEQISADKDRRAGALTAVVQAVTEYHGRADKRLQWLDAASKKLRNNASNINNRVVGIRERTNAARSAVEDVSEYDNTARLSKRRYDTIRERYSSVRRRIEQVGELAERNRAVTGENNRFADRNTDRVEGIKQIAEQVREVIKITERELEQERSRTRTSSMDMGF